MSDIACSARRALTLALALTLTLTLILTLTLTLTLTPTLARCAGGLARCLRPTAC